MTFDTESKPIFASSFLNRSTKMRFQAAEIERLSKHKATHYILIWNGQILFNIKTPIPRVKLMSANDPRLRELITRHKSEKNFLGYLSGRPIFFCDISKWTCLESDERIENSFIDESRNHHPLLPDSWKFCEIRSFLSVISESDAELVATAKGLYEWLESSIFCSKCGSRTLRATAGWEKHCPVCKGKHFPRVDPVVIMLIEKGDKTLLGRSHIWPKGMFSCLAGFMEPGESIETAAVRETFEETGVEITNVKYITSQPWPFPA